MSAASVCSKLVAGTGRLTSFAAEGAAYVHAFDPKRDEIAKAEEP
jgi:hypothetical protein